MNHVTSQWICKSYILSMSPLLVPSWLSLGVLWKERSLEDGMGLEEGPLNSLHETHRKAEVD